MKNEKNLTYMEIFDANKAIERIVDDIKIYFSSMHEEAKAIIGISGGKDSTVAAALLVRALGRDRVIGVTMPQGVQHDIEVSCRVIQNLGIKRINVNIGEATTALYQAIDHDRTVSCTEFDGVVTNTPARIRMATLYAIAAMVHGRVINTCNFSEDYVGYSTKFGDNAGDYSVLSNYTVTEVRTIGRALGLPAEFVEKVPEDGMSGMSDEEKLGFTYEELDNYILDNVTPEFNHFQRIKHLNTISRHKEKHMPTAHNLYETYRWGRGRGRHGGAYEEFVF